MPLLTKPLYQRSEGPDEDRWRLVFDTDARRLFVEHEATRGDMRGFGYSTVVDEIDLAAYLGGCGEDQYAQNQSEPGRQELVRLLGSLFDDRNVSAAA